MFLNIGYPGRRGVYGFNAKEKTWWHFSNGRKNNSFSTSKCIKNSKDLGKKLGEVLIESGIVSEEDIIDAIVAQTGIKK